MTVTASDRSALASALRELKLSGMLATLDARLARDAGDSATWTSSRSSAKTRSPAASPCHWRARSSFERSREVNCPCRLLNRWVRALPPSWRSGSGLV
jgi:hypothetical protein